MMWLLVEVMVAEFSSPVLTISTVASHWRNACSEQGVASCAGDGVFMCDMCLSMSYQLWDACHNQACRRVDAARAQVGAITVQPSAG